MRPVDLWRVDVLFCEDEPSLFSFLIRKMVRLDMPVTYATLLFQSASYYTFLDYLFLPHIQACQPND